jgi:hypothetical protein
MKENEMNGIEAVKQLLNGKMVVRNEKIYLIRHGVIVKGIVVERVIDSKHRCYMNSHISNKEIVALLSSDGFDLYTERGLLAIDEW